MTKPLDEPRDSVNNYIVEKDQEWVRRWEAREQTFRKEIAALRDHYEQKLITAERFDRIIHEQQAVILKIRDEFPIIGKWLIRWAGYTE